MTKSESAVAHGTVLHEMISALVLKANPFWRRTVKSEMPLDELPTCIYMANHISFSDPFVLCGAVPEAKAVAISNLWDNPLIGPVFRNNGDLPVFFEELEDGTYGKHTAGDTRKTLIGNAAKYLADGVNVALFPEGEVSPTGELLPMKYGFFKLAMETGTPIVPIGMWGNQDAWGMNPPKDGLSVPRTMLGAADIQVHIGSPISSSDGITLDELVVKVCSEIDRLTKGLPNYTMDIYMKN